MKNSVSLLVVLGLFGLLTACAQMNPHPMDMAQAVKKATTRADHEALVKHYEDAAKEMQSKANERKKTLEEYESHAAYYGKRAQDLQSHTQAMINAYEQAARANLDMAKSHRMMAEAIK